VCGVVAVSKDKRKILVVESTQRKNHWVLPKGGFETDEARPEDAALRVFLLPVSPPFSHNCFFNGHQTKQPPNRTFTDAKLSILQAKHGKKPASPAE